MSLAEALARQEKRTGATCSVAAFINSLNEPDSATLREALALSKEQLQHAQIHRALKETYPDRKVPDATTIRRHRTGGCQCPPA